MSSARLASRRELLAKLPVLTVKPVLLETLLAVLHTWPRVTEYRRRCPGRAHPCLRHVAQHVDGAVSLGDLPLQPGEELASRRTVLVRREQRFGGVRLGGLQECRELDPIDAEPLGRSRGLIAAAPARTARSSGRTSAALLSCGGSQGWPVSAVQIRRSRPRSLVSVVTPQPPRWRGRRWALPRPSIKVSASSSGSSSSTSSGSRAAASRTSNFPVFLTSAIRRVRYFAEEGNLAVGALHSRLDCSSCLPPSLPRSSPAP